MPKYTAKLNIELEIDADNEEQAFNCAQEYIYDYYIEGDSLDWKIEKIEDWLKCQNIIHLQNNE